MARSNGCGERAGEQNLQGAERRAWIRYPHETLALGQLFGSRQEEWSATLQDISQTGLGLVINRSFPASTVLNLRLQTASRTFSRTMLLRVKHCSPRPDGNWLIGCTFVVKLTEAQLAELLA